MRKAVVFGMAFVLVLFAAGCARKSAHLTGGKINEVLGEEKIDSRIITAIGIAGAEQGLESVTQRRATSREAAIVAAQYQLVTMVKGVRLEGGVTIEKAMQTDSVIAATVDSEIVGAVPVSSEWTDDDGCVVTLQLDLQGLAKKAGLKLGKD